jgi:DNA glycosylase AlkZ-like
VELSEQTSPKLTRAQILATHREVGALEERLPRGRRSLRRAAWAGLQDSMPRAALLSIHARVAGTGPSAWEDPSLVQLWGPRFSAYVVPMRDLAVFSLGRLPDGKAARRRAEDLAARLGAHLGDRRMTYAEAGTALGVDPNALRYAAATGTVVMRWDGARQPTIWAVPRPKVEPHAARAELARRYLHVFGPSTAAAFAQWAGITPREGGAAFESVATELLPVRTPIGDASILRDDEPLFASRSRPPSTAVRLLPSGDAYYLLQGADRELLVPDAKRRSLLWTSRVWPGAVLANGEIVGTWRRAHANVTIELWQRLRTHVTEAIESEAMGLPLPGVDGPLAVHIES